MATNKAKHKIPAIVRERPVAAAVVSKVTTEQNRVKYSLSNLNIQEIAKSTTDKIQKNEDILQLFPDIEICIRILVSSILSPNDMIGNTLTYDAPNLTLPLNVKQTITNTIKEYIETNYNLEDKLYNILKETLFTKGAYIEAIVPEASVDDVIHQIDNNNKIVSVESFIQEYPKSIRKGSLNLIGNTTELFSNTITINDVPNKSEQIQVSAEDLGIEFTSNYNLLNLSQSVLIANEYLNSKSLYGDLDLFSHEDELDRLFKNAAKYKSQDLVELKTMDNTSRRSLTRPMIMKLPTESVIPVHVINDPSRHLGYFILLDENGMPITRSESIESMMFNGEESFTYKETRSTQTFNLISKAKNAISSLTGKTPTIQEIEGIYTDIVENMIKDKINKGAYGSLASIRTDADIYRVMFNRALKNQQTRLLYIPSELISYFAFEYRENGTGLSLIEKSAVLFSVRSILLFARLMAHVKNSITTTKVTATIDDNDPDPEKSIAAIISNAMKTRQVMLPFGVDNLGDMVQWAHSVGFIFDIKGAGLPDMNLDISEVNTAKIIPDTELEDEIRKFIYQSFGLNPEMIDNAYQTDYATTVVSHNILFAKYIKQLQNVFAPLITKHVQKLILNDPVLQDEIRSVVLTNMKAIKDIIKKDMINNKKELDKIDTKNIINYILRKYIRELYISLPEPETNDADSLNKALSVYSQNLDTYLDTVMSTNAIPEAYAGKLSSQVDTLKAIMKAMLMKRKMTQNNFLPEINEIYTKDVDGKPIFSLADEFLTHVKSLYEALDPMLNKIAKEKEKMDDKFSKVEEKLGSSMGGGFDSGSSDDSGGDGMDDGMGEDGGEGDDDMGMDFDMDDTGDEGGDENTEDTPEETPEDNQDQNQNNNANDKEEEKKEEDQKNNDPTSNNPNAPKL